MTAIYLLFVELTYGSSSPGVRNDVFGIAALSALWVAFIVICWGLTLSRAPRAVRREPEALVVRDSYGRMIRFPTGPDYELTVLHRYPASWMSPEPTELVRLVSAAGPRATYLVGRDLLAS